MREIAEHHIEDISAKIDDLTGLNACCVRRSRNALAGRQAELERTGEAQISLTDPDCRTMAAHTKVSVGYNIAVDAKRRTKQPHGPQAPFKMETFGSMLQLPNLELSSK